MNGKAITDAACGTRWTPSQRPRRCTKAATCRKLVAAAAARPGGSGDPTAADNASSSRSSSVPLASTPGSVQQAVEAVSRRAAAALLAAAVSGAALLAPPAGAVTQEQLLFLEAWRAVDRAYVDKKFKGQNWFKAGPAAGCSPPCLACLPGCAAERPATVSAALHSAMPARTHDCLPAYLPACLAPHPQQVREDSLKKVPMGSHAETHEAIRALLASLGDPFTRFLAPEQYTALRWARWDGRRGGWPAWTGCGAQLPGSLAAL